MARTGVLTFRRGETCICYACRRARSKAERLAKRRRPVRSDEVAAKISELRQEGFTLTEISEASQLSIGVVHKASKEGAWLRPETAERILELEVAPEIV